jgi:ribosome-associated heat shock protein Hsp15
MEKKETRIDKYLWEVRLFKSRSAAAEACKKGKVVLGDHPVKPSHYISEGDIITLKRPPVTHTYLVRGIPENRVSAKLAPDFVSDLTPETEKNKVRPESGSFFGYRPRGKGRPTKRERREIEDFLE